MPQLPSRRSRRISRRRSARPVAAAAAAGALNGFGWRAGHAGRRHLEVLEIALGELHHARVADRAVALAVDGQQPRAEVARHPLAPPVRRRRVVTHREDQRRGRSCRARGPGRGTRRDPRPASSRSGSRCSRGRTRSGPTIPHVWRTASRYGAAPRGWSPSAAMIAQKASKSTPNRSTPNSSPSDVGRAAARARRASRRSSATARARTSDRPGRAARGRRRPSRLGWPASGSGSRSSRSTSASIAASGSSPPNPHAGLVAQCIAKRSSTFSKPAACSRGALQRPVHPHADVDRRVERHRAQPAREQARVGGAERRAVRAAEVRELLLAEGDAQAVDVARRVAGRHVRQQQRVAFQAHPSDLACAAGDQSGVDVVRLGHAGIERRASGRSRSCRRRAGRRPRGRSAR